MNLLKDLPLPSKNNKGWPWTEQSFLSESPEYTGKKWPKISIVTPSFNHGKFIEETIRSVLLQNYPNLEFIIIDGGSSDDSVETIRKYEPWLNFWISEPDTGQSNAINKGLLKCTGEYVNWICSDDVFCKDALINIASLVAGKEVLLMGDGFRIDQNSKIIDFIKSSEINSIDQLVNLKKYWRGDNSILQQSTFFPLKAIKEAGLLNEKNHYTMDFELWGRLLNNGIGVKRSDIQIGMFRWYPGQKTSNKNTVTKSLIGSNIKLILDNKSYGKPEKLKRIYQTWSYFIGYHYHNFRSLLGIKRRIKSFFHG